MSPFPDIKMHGNGQARNDVGIRTSPCWPNWTTLSCISNMLPTCWQHAQLRPSSQMISPFT